MVSFWRKRARNLASPAIRYAKYAPYAVAALCLVLAACFLAAKLGADNRLEANRRAMTGGAQAYLIEARVKCAQTGVRGTDVKGDTLPSIRELLHAADALNRAYAASYGTAMLDADAYDATLAALDEYERLLAIGAGTDEADAALSACLAALSEGVEARFGTAGLLASP